MSKTAINLLRILCCLMLYIGFCDSRDDVEQAETAAVIIKTSVILIIVTPVKISIRVNIIGYVVMNILYLSTITVRSRQ